MKRLLNQLGRIILTFGVFLYVIFEELVWDLIAQPIYDYLHALRLLQTIEVKVKTLKPYTVLLLFLVLFIQGEAMGVLSLALLAQGNLVMGISLYLAKLPFAAFTFWLFRVSKDILLTFVWFKYSYDGLERFVDFIKASSIHQNMLALIVQAKSWLKSKTEVVSQVFSSIKTELSKRLGFSGK